MYETQYTLFGQRDMTNHKPVSKTKNRARRRELHSQNVELRRQLHQEKVFSNKGNPNEVQLRIDAISKKGN